MKGLWRNFSPWLIVISKWLGDEISSIFFHRKRICNLFQHLLKIRENMPNFTIMILNNFGFFGLETVMLRGIALNWDKYEPKNCQNLSYWSILSIGMCSCTGTTLEIMLVVWKRKTMKNIFLKFFEICCHFLFQKRFFWLMGLAKSSVLQGRE